MKGGDPMYLIGSRGVAIEINREVDTKDVICQLQELTGKPLKMAPGNKQGAKSDSPSGD